MGTYSSINTAVLYAAYGSRASYYDDWLDAFIEESAFDVASFNIAQRQGRVSFEKDVKTFELIIALHSVNADNLIYALDIKSALQARKGLLLSFVGNELSLPSAPLKPKIDYLREVGVDFVATQLLLDSGRFLYESTGAKVVAVPHALNPKSFYPMSINSERPIDIGMRTFRYPSTFLGDEDRNNLVSLFSDNKFMPELHSDIATNKRLKRSDWAFFLNNCKGTIANEAGGYWLDRDDATMLQIKNWLISKNGGRMTLKSSPLLRRIIHKLPWSVRQALIKIFSVGPMQHEGLIGEEEDFREVYQLFFAEKPWPPEISGKCVSSRHFDAAGTKTCQIMIDGRFNDIFKAHEHFIPLKRDLSNADEAVRMFQDNSLREEMIERTYAFVMDEHTYPHRIKDIRKIIFNA